MLDYRCPQSSVSILKVSEDNNKICKTRIGTAPVFRTDLSPASPSFRYKINRYNDVVANYKTVEIDKKETVEL